MNSSRRIVLVLAAVFPLAAHAACSATNGDAIPSQVFDASALDVAVDPSRPQADADTSDGSTTKDAASDAPSDAKDAAPTSGPVQINEVFVDNDGLGDGAEFIELRAAPGTAADDLKIRILRSNGDVKYEIAVGAAGAKFSAGGLFVVGGNQTFKLNVTDHVDTALGLNGWGLDNDRGAVQLLRGATLLDVLGYDTNADAGAIPAPPSPPTATVEGKPALIPDPPVGSAGSKKHRSVGRKTAAADTNDNLSDFCAMEASPGYAQKPCL